MVTFFHYFFIGKQSFFTLRNRICNHKLQNICYAYERDAFAPVYLRRSCNIICSVLPCKNILGSTFYGHKIQEKLTDILSKTQLKAKPSAIECYFLTLFIRKLWQLPISKVYLIKYVLWQTAAYFLNLQFLFFAVDSTHILFYCVVIASLILPPLYH